MGSEIIKRLATIDTLEDNVVVVLVGDHRSSRACSRYTSNATTSAALLPASSEPPSRCLLFCHFKRSDRNDGWLILEKSFDRQLYNRYK
jgi:hypothetical protein